MANTHKNNILSLLFVAVFQLIFYLSSYGADELYLRAVNGSDLNTLDESYKLKLISDEGGREVYNWFGDVPESFVIADKNYDICLGAEDALSITKILSIVNSKSLQLKFIHPSDADLIVINENETTRKQSVLKVINDKGSWTIQFMEMMFYSPGLVVNNEPMIIDENEEYYLFSWDGPKPAEFFSFQNKNAGTLYDCIKKEGSSSTYVTFPDLQTVYDLAVAKSGNRKINTEELKTQSIKILVKISKSNGTPKLVISKGNYEVGYCLVCGNGQIYPMKSDELGKYSITENLDNSGFVIATYNRINSDGEINVSPTFSDLTGYYSNFGGMPYFNDEILDFNDAIPSVISELPFMKVAEDWNGIIPVSFTFNPESKILVCTRQTACVRIPVYFLNNVNYEAPHIRVENNEGKLYTSSSGSAMNQKEVELLGGDNRLWRYDLWLPERELSLNTKSPVKASKNILSAAPEIVDNSVVSPSNQSTMGEASNINLTFSDGKSSTTSSQFTNVPLIPGGVYSVIDSNETTPSLKSIYVVRIEGNQYYPFQLKQTDPGSYVYEGVLLHAPITGKDTYTFYISTDIDDNGSGTGTTYGAASSAISSAIASDLSNKEKNNNYNGRMIIGSDNPWTIDFSEVDIPEEFKESALSAKVEINPEMTPSISFGFSTKDFQTDQAEIARQTDTVTRWFNLQGLEISSPERGLNIKVTGRESVKYLVP